MSKVAHYLQEHLLGEVSESADARAYFSTDASVFQVTPSIIVYPRNEQDVRKTARFSWQLAERGRIVPLTARGAGTDLSGGAIGTGIILAFQAHMNRIVQLDTRNGHTIVEPGLMYGRLQQTLHTHDRFLPAYPASMEFSTIGGAVANNAAGDKSFKYGATKEYVKSLRVVLANGEVITTGQLSKRELNKKMGLSTFEGEIYRQLDALLEENKSTIETMRRGVTRSTAGYNLLDCKRKSTFDLTPLFVGAQGTLGVITEMTLTTEEYNPETSLVAVEFDALQPACEVIMELRKLATPPSALEFVDGQLLSFVNRLNPNQLKGSLATKEPRVVLLVEFDDNSDRIRRKGMKQARAIFSKYSATYTVASDHTDKAKLWKIRQASASLLAHSEQHVKAVPLIDDAVVPVERLATLIERTYRLFAEEKMQIALWGHAGDGNLHLQPFLDLAQLGDRQRAFRLYDEYYKLIFELGGSTSAQHNDGRLRAPLLPAMFGADVYTVFQKVKKIFDPHGTLNPGVKIDVTLDQSKQQLRSHYTLGHLHNYMPRS